MDKQKQEGLGWAVLLIGVGIVILFNNFGIVPWTIWRYLFRFWPVLLIIGGLEMIIGKSFAGQFVVAFVWMLVLVFLFVSFIAINDGMMYKNFQRIAPWLPSRQMYDFMKNIPLPPEYTGGRAL